ncbi:MAG TPA: hypothetical protein V6C76_05870 [Drouetiella sp.]
MKSLAFLSIIIAAAFVFECAAGARETGTAGDTLHLKQTHYFLGDLDVKASKNGVRIQSLGSWKFVLVSHAPEWTVTVFRKDDKSYFSEPFKQFSETGLVSQLLVGKKTEAKGAVAKPTNMKVGNERVMRAMNPFCLGEYVDGKNLVAPQVIAILYSSTRMPNYGGIALRWMQKKDGRDWMTGLKDSSMHVMLSTTSVDIEPGTPGLYDVPTGYKRAKDMREILLSKESRASSADADDLFEMGK